MTDGGQQGRLAGKRAVVTGAASGIGRAIAARFAQAGARAVVLDVDGPALADLEAGLDGVEGHATVDVTDGAAVTEAVRAAADVLGGIDVVVNNAGIPMVGTVRDLTDDAWDRALDVDLKSVFLVSRAAWPHLEAAGGGVIVNTASIAGYDGQIGQAAYSASKGGVIALTLTAARDLAAAGIRVNTIAPGLIDTPLLGALPEEARSELAKSVLFPQRLGVPDDFASLAMEIVRNRYLNGEVIRMDAGIRMPPK